MSGDAPVVEAIHLRKTYFGKIDVPVLHDINMTVCQGEFLAVIGQSGSGKSTLLNIIGCLDVPSGGILRIDGRDVGTLEDDELARIRGDKIGFVFQYHYLIDELTCLENALLPLAIRRTFVRAEDEARVRALLDRVGLTGQLRQTPDTLSGGECQRCALVRALANEPRLVLADEPTGNLDRISGRQVFDLLRQVSRETGVAVVMVTHDDRLACAADRILQIEDGRIRQLSAAEQEAMARYGTVSPMLPADSGRAESPVLRT